MDNGLHSKAGNTFISRMGNCTHLVHQVKPQEAVMSTNPDNPDNSQDEEAEAREFEQHLQQLAEVWRERLKDPAIQKQVASGALVINPLVLELVNDVYPQPKEK